jgi:hypothetical protein
VSHWNGNWVGLLSTALGFACAPLGHAQCHAQIVEGPVDEEVRPDEMADLAITGMDVSPRIVAPGEDVAVVLHVENRHPFDPALGVEVVLIARGEIVGQEVLDMDPASKTSLQMSLSYPAEGSFGLTAALDPTAHFSELDRFDNTLTKTIVVAPGPPDEADFVLQDLNVESELDGPRQIAATVRNDGTVAGGSVLVLRADNEIVAVRQFDAVMPGSSITIKEPLPTNLEQARITAEVVSPDRERSATARVPDRTVATLEAPPGADLVIKDLSIHGAAHEEGRPRQVTVSFKVVNLGHGAVTTPFQVTVLPGEEMSDPGKPVVLEIDTVDPGKAVAVSHTLPNAPNAFEVRVEVDPEGIVTERDKRNNVATSEFRNPTPNLHRWISIGPRRLTGAQALGYSWDDATGRLSTIAIHPQSPAIIYVGATSAGVWKTTNGGQSWQPISDAADLNIVALALDPSNLSRVLFATRHRGIYESLNGGTSWTPLTATNLNVPAYYGSLIVSPTDPDRIYLTTMDGVRVSNNGGSTWPLKLSGIATGLVIDPANPSRLYAAITDSSNANDAGVYRSLDSGETWTPMTGCGASALPVEDQDTLIRLAFSKGRIYASYRKNNPLSWALFRTGTATCSTGGVMQPSWVKGWQSPHPAIHWAMWADPTDSRYIYVGGIYLYRSDDSGNTFAVMSAKDTNTTPFPSAHMDHHYVGIDPQSSNVVYSLNDGGIYRSPSHGAPGTWILIGEGIANVEFYDHADAASEPNLTIGGTQDNGVTPL